MLSNSIILFVATLFVCVKSQDIDDLIQQVFNNNTGGSEPPVTNKPRNPDPPVTSGSGLPGTDGCTCVPYYLCNNGSVNTNGEGIIDIRIRDGPCESYIEQCCGKDDQSPTPITPTPPPNKPKGCGNRNPDGIGFRITGDQDHEAQFGEFPWMVAILREEQVEGNPNKLNVYQCGGALIHPQVVLTAAHCVSAKNKQFKIRAGEWDTQTTKELFPHQDREVESIIIHPQYYAGALYNDVALLFLKVPVDIVDNVDVVCLPQQDHVVDHGKCFTTGWGKDVFGKEGRYQVILKKIELPMVPHQKCQTELRKSRLGQAFQLHRSFVCAGSKGKDACKGDGGGPLVCPINKDENKYIQVGIVAWGVGCGEYPGVYANVALYRKWIDDQMIFKNFDHTSYQF